ncbi:hypothetical protein Tco_0932539, partial [Tanacetum coccineum]
KRNLSTITCSLSQSDLADCFDEYGIALCYDPKLPSSNATDLDAPKGYIPLYLSLFSIGNLCFHLNNFCLDVFEIFRCHFPLLSPFGVARVTTFTVACKAYGREDTVPLFRSLLTLGPTGDWFTFQKRHDFSIPTIFGDSMSNILKWKSEFIFVKRTLISDMRPGLISDFRHGQGSFSHPYPTEPFDEFLRARLCHHPFETHTFSDPIIYLAGLTDSWEHTHGIPSILINGEDMAFQNFMKKPGQSPSFSMRLANRPVDVGSLSMSHLTLVVNDDQVESSSYSRDKGVMGHELVVVGEGCSEQDVMVVEGSKKRRSITEALKEEATVVRPVSKKKKSEGSRRRDKLGFLTFDELVDVYDIHALQMAVVGNMLMNESRILSQGHSKLKNDLVSLNSKKCLLEHVMSNLEVQLAKAQKNQDVKESRKKLVEEVDGLQSRLKETENLVQRCQDLEHERDFLFKKSEEVSVLTSQLEAAKLKKSKLVKEFLPLAVKKLFESEHFNQALGDLQQKAIMFGRSQALDEMHGLGDS